MLLRTYRRPGPDGTIRCMTGMPGMTGRWHLLVGALGVVVFLATGLYMATQFPQLHGGNEAIRYQFRANHAYILLSSLANVLAGLAAGSLPRTWRFQTQRLGSLLLLIAPPVFFAAFILEPPRASPERWITTSGMVLTLAGTALQALARLRVGRLL